MELNVRTLHGAVSLRAAEEWTVNDLKTTLHRSYPNLHAPEPKLQNLVHAGRLLPDGPLQTAGLTPGANVVLLSTIAAPKATPLPTTPAPTASDIRAAIVEEARRRGIEHKLRDESTAHPHTSLNLPTDLMDMDNQLMGLIEALEGRLGLLRQTGRQAAAAGALETAAGDSTLLSGPGDVPVQQRAAAAAAAVQAPEPIPDIQPPEPEAEHVANLCDMGFPEQVVRKALMLHRNRVPEAVEWLLMHAEDDDAAEPVTQEQLRRIYGTPQRASAAVPRAALGAEEGPAAPAASAGAVASALRELHMSLLQAVGIDADSAQGLLDRTDGAPDSAAAGLDQASAQSAAADPLQAFRRRLQQQLGEGRQEDLDAAASSLADLFPLDTLMNLGVHDEDEEDDDEEHDHDEDEDEGEGEGEEEEDDEDDAMDGEEEEEEEEGAHEAPAVPDTFQF